MKKLLLSASIALLTVGGANAAVVTDGITYAPVNGINCVSNWIIDRNHNLAAFEASTIAKAGAKARTAVTYDGVIYVGNSLNDDPTIADGEGKPIDCAGIDMFSLADGSYLGKLKVTLDGTRISGLLCANQVGVDDFGNLWIAGYSASKLSNYKIYAVDKVTGAATLVADLEREIDARIDYSDLVGDVTRVQAKSTIMAAGASSAAVYCWRSEQGGEWEPGWDGIDTGVVFNQFYPANQTIWGTAPTVSIVLGPEDTKFDAEIFYIDGFTTTPSLYRNDYSIIESFEKAPDLAPLDAGTNGIAEFNVDGRDFIAYSFAQYEKGGRCELNVCELGSGMVFEGMTKYWTLPEDGLGTISDTGTRVHSIGSEYTADGTGVNLTTYKCNNGLGSYYIGTKSGVNDATIGSSATITTNGNVITVSEEASEIAIFNIAGQLVNKVNNATEIAVPADGAYIVKATVAGAPVVKKVVL